MTQEKVIALGSMARQAFVQPRGLNPIWLPNFTITLLRSPHLPPTWAQFLVPLKMNKLDIKDYLWNAYGVPVLSVRSFIQQQPMQLQNRGKRALQRRWYRPRSIKKMIVEMGTRDEGRDGKGGGVFVWPDSPDTDNQEIYEAWDKNVYDKARKEQREMSKFEDPQFANRIEPLGRKAIAEQAMRLLDGKDNWQSTWKDLKRQR